VTGIGYRYLTGVATLQLDQVRCNGCRMCTEVCPHGVFEVEHQKAAIVDLDACMECGACAINCDSGAITVQTGVGCATAIIYGALTGTEPTCGPADSGSTCCG
jgi:NAD-dependent dihydropyrimidine dehydrogenase PreA subunit